jgi:hypothetical protein
VRVVFIIFYDFSWCGSTCEMAKKCLFSLGNLGDFQTHSKTGWFSRVLTHPKKCRARVFFSGGGRLPEPRAARNSVFAHHSFTINRLTRRAAPALEARGGGGLNIRSIFDRSSLHAPLPLIHAYHPHRDREIRRHPAPVEAPPHTRSGLRCGVHGTQQKTGSRSRLLPSLEQWYPFRRNEHTSLHEGRTPRCLALSFFCSCTSTFLPCTGLGSIRP